MKRYNIGEWSEIYTILKIIYDGKFFVVNSSLASNQIICTYDIVNIFRFDYLNLYERKIAPQAINKEIYKNMIDDIFNYIFISKETTF